MKRVLEPGGDLGQRERIRLRRRKLEREGKPVETRAYLCSGDLARLIKQEVRPVLSRASDEERQGVVMPEGGHPPGDLPRHAERFAARCQDVDSRAARQQVLDNVGGGADQVLAVVEQEQQTPVGQLLDQGLHRDSGPDARPSRGSVRSPVPPNRHP